MTVSSMVTVMTMHAMPKTAVLPLVLALSPHPHTPQQTWKPALSHPLDALCPTGASSGRSSLPQCWRRCSHRSSATTSM